MGHPKGCLLAGMYSYTDWKDEKANALKDKAQAAPYLSKACDLGQHLGCARFGEMSIQGEHIPVLNFFQKKKKMSCIFFRENDFILFSEKSRKRPRGF